MDLIFEIMTIYFFSNWIFIPYPFLVNIELDKKKLHIKNTHIYVAAHYTLMDLLDIESFVNVWYH